ncbi:hypothetical protein HY772_00155 [Candidatus Woesearchaeota archaeon]|nr:hypothetical protein [Candidatus Woesearchaeota archaeon]
MHLSKQPVAHEFSSLSLSSLVNEDFSTATSLIDFFLSVYYICYVYVGSALDVPLPHCVSYTSPEAKTYSQQSNTETETGCGSSRVSHNEEIFYSIGCIWSIAAKLSFKGKLMAEIALSNTGSVPNLPLPPCRAEAINLLLNSLSATKMTITFTASGAAAERKRDS